MSLFSKKYPVTDSGFTTDIHAHILPAVDDGARSLDNSVAILRSLQEKGLKRVVLTPHLNPEIFHHTPSELKTLFEKFQQELPQDIHIQLYLAAEYMVHPGFLEDISDDMLCYPDRSILIEMSYLYRSENIREAIFELNMAGYKPIIAHPERYMFYQKELSSIRDLYEMDCRFQLNIMSLSGCYGRDSLKMIDFLMKRDLYSYMATDVHHEDQLTQMFATSVTEEKVRILEQLAKNNESLVR